jgi:hypothetical protein
MGGDMSLFKGIKIWDIVSSTYKGLQFNAEAPQVCAQNYLDAMAEGDISGHSVWSKIGYRESSTSGVEVTVSPQLSATEYVFPTTEKTMTIVSSSADDDGDPVGTGARTITVYYLDGSYAEKQVTVTMNGTSTVQIGTDVFRIQNVRVSTAGSLNATAGNITIASGGVTYGYIRAGKTRQRQCIWTVPAGKTLYITEINFSASNMGSTKYSRFTLKATYDDKAGSVLRAEFFMPFIETGLMNDNYIRRLYPPVKLPATTDLKVVCTTNDTGSVLTCGLRGWTE